MCCRPSRLATERVHISDRGEISPYVADPQRDQWGVLRYGWVFGLTGTGTEHVRDHGHGFGPLKFTRDARIIAIDPVGMLSTRVEKGLDAYDNAHRQLSRCERYLRVQRNSEVLDKRKLIAADEWAVHEFGWLPEEGEHMLSVQQLGYLWTCKGGVEFGRLKSEYEVRLKSAYPKRKGRIPNLRM